jgi:hypothetical protein
MTRQKARMIILAKRVVSSIALCDYLESKSEYALEEAELLEDFDKYMSTFYV